jgi:hypothetical protein
MADPIIRKTLRETAGLREGGAASRHEILATYANSAGEDVFAICRNGLLLRSDEGWRYVDHDEIAVVDIPPTVKSEIADRRLVLKLRSGERLDVQVDGGEHNSLDVFPIYMFVSRRIHQRRMLGPA